MLSGHREYIHLPERVCAQTVHNFRAKKMFLKKSSKLIYFGANSRLTVD